MNVLSLPTWGNTIFCDDIRNEIQGTISLIGVYTSAMYVGNAFPQTLPKFGLFIRFVQIPGEIKGRLTLKVSVPGFEEPVINQTFELSDVPKLEDAQADDPSLDKRTVLQMPFIISPLVLKEEGVIKVRLYSGNDEYRLGGLRVLRAPSLI